LILGRFEEALEAYKMLLYFAPGDSEAARMVQELETRAYQESPQKLRKDAEPLVPFETRSAAEVLSADPGLKRERWVRKIERLQALLLNVERYRHQH
jgi:hypothetical protein